MFDISFSELMIIGVIALIVIGPERLPKVARTVGHLFGRAQRYVNEVKTDIQKEMDLTEIGNIKSQMEDAARSVKTSMKDSLGGLGDLKSLADDSGKALQEGLDEARKAFDPKSLVADEPAAQTDKKAIADSASVNAGIEKEDSHATPSISAGPGADKATEDAGTAKASIAATPTSDNALADAHASKASKPAKPSISAEPGADKATADAGTAKKNIAAATSADSASAVSASATSSTPADTPPEGQDAAKAAATGNEPKDSAVAGTDDTGDSSHKASHETSSHGSTA